MPPKKAPIYCLVHGIPEVSVFGIKYDKNTTVDEFKETIYTKKKNAFANIDYPDLTLYQVNIDLNTQNPQRTALTNPNSNIVGDLGGQVLRPMDNIEEKFTAPANGHIHIIVDVPAVALPVAAEGSDNEILIRLENKVDSIIKNVQQQSEQQISSVSARDWDKIQAFHGLDNIEAINLSIEHLGLNANDIVNVNSFGWDERNERAQNDRYIPHLNQILRIGTYRTLTIFDPTSNADFFTTDAGIYLPLRLAGTTDAVVVDRFSVAAMFPDCHIRIVLELKKRVENKDRYQALAKLTTSDLRSNHAVLTVLTDLNDTWVFFWFEQKKVKTLTLPRNTAVALINNNMKLANQENMAKENNQSEEASTEEQGPLPKRQKLKHIVTSNVSSDIDPMEDFFDMMTEEEIFRYKTKRVLTQFFSKPIFSELNNYQRTLPL
ncbi:16209_t:CDS:2 [Funneliformis geosporum]|uniref:1821_t:CDS:1 n=1 Tax=Funneliformis geosporum TaxID=1117311 RepID=A0A9W4WY53_9GLOM|nr:1821_t:CDS:2 [Funneliformis geosporum]CAI2172880.1 16209_t:CDS:2 [Funneliformis geosporum]